MIAFKLVTHHLVVLFVFVVVAVGGGPLEPSSSTGHGATNNTTATPSLSKLVLVLDIGSHHTSSATYGWSDCFGRSCLAKVKQLNSLNFNGGLGQAFQQSPENVPGYIHTVVTQTLTAWTGLGVHPATVLCFGQATAGLRVLSVSVARQLLADFQQAFEATGCQIGKPFTVIDGGDEGAWGWMAVMAATSPFDDRLAVADLGGGSTQISVALEEDIPGVTRLVEFAGQRWHLFSQSFLGWGVNAALDAAIQFETSQAARRQRDLHPLMACRPGAPDAALHCQRLVHYLLHQHEINNQTLAGQFRASRLPSLSHVAGISGYWYGVHLVYRTDRRGVIHVSLANLTDTADRQCSYGDASAEAELVRDAKVCPCFHLTYIVELLRLFGATDETTLEFHSGIRWDAGFVLEVAEQQGRQSYQHWRDGARLVLPVRQQEHVGYSFGLVVLAMACFLGVRWWLASKSTKRTPIVNIAF
eukprot:m.75795 g.75795  ORF g.75795 m.75795 type:complete len:472 (-) comp14494_c0_seq2:101-1516(-)